MHRSCNLPGLAALAAATLACLAGCGERGAAEDEDHVAAEQGCPDDAGFTGQLHGSIDARVEWRGSSLDCEGMPRPDESGARLRFGGTLANGRELTVIVALPELERGHLPQETPAVVTLIAEDEGQFFSNADSETCWSDIDEQTPLDDDRYTVTGIVYCVAPLREINGPGSITFTELDYAGLIDWSAP